jgi:hypothetical protein
MSYLGQNKQNIQNEGIDEQQMVQSERHQITSVE